MKFLSSCGRSSFSRRALLAASRGSKSGGSARRLHEAFAVVALLVVFSLRASAQTIYLPAQYQYGDAQKFYYGGTDPAVIAAAQQPTDAGWGRSGGYAFTSGDVQSHRSVVNEPIRVFSDAVPGQNAHIFGFTVTDAANSSNASVARYFRKSATTKPSEAAIVVPAQAFTDQVPVPPAALPK